MCPIGVACYPRRICTLHHRLTSLYPGQRSGNHPCHSFPGEYYRSLSPFYAYSGHQSSVLFHFRLPYLARGQHAAAMTQARTNLGPLTTPFTYPSSCGVVVQACSTCSYGWQGQTCSDNSFNTLGVQDDLECWPPRSTPDSTNLVAVNGWGFYSPGIECPVGYATACAATGGVDGGFGFQFSILPSETVVGCCPSYVSSLCSFSLTRRLLTRVSQQRFCLQVYPRNRQGADLLQVLQHRLVADGAVRRRDFRQVRLCHRSSNRHSNHHTDRHRRVSIEDGGCPREYLGLRPHDPDQPAIQREFHKFHTHNSSIPRQHGLADPPTRSCHPEVRRVVPRRDDWNCRRCSDCRPGLDRHPLRGLDAEATPALPGRDASPGHDASPGRDASCTD